MMKMLVKFLVTFVSSWTKSKELPINSWEEKKGEPMQRSWINFKRSKYMSCKFLKWFIGIRFTYETFHVWIDGDIFVSKLTYPITTVANEVAEDL